MWSRPFNTLSTDGDLCHQEQEKKLAKKFKIVETYWHDHALEISWGALSDGTGTISLLIQPLSGEKFSEFFRKKTSVLKELKQSKLDWSQ
jgi:hypothetical protein